MWIRSQDKRVLFKCEVVYVTKRILRIGESDYVVTTYRNGDLDLGNYSTEEKALKVLDMIDEHLEKMYIGTSNYMGKPFQMPQDEEV